MAKRPVLGQIVAKAVIVFKNGRLGFELPRADPSSRELS
jgi:hypothetical protein